MAYTPRLAASKTIETTGNYSFSMDGYRSKDGDNITYYLSISFTGNGTATLAFSAIFLGSSRIRSKVAESSVTFDREDGWPVTDLANSVVTPATVGHEATVAYTINVTAGHTYYFYFREISNSIGVDILPIIRFNKTSGESWTKVLDESIGTVTANQSRTVRQQDHKLYCFKFRTLSSGCVIRQTSYTQTVMYVTTTGDDLAFDPDSGYVYESYCIPGCYEILGPENSVQINDVGTLYFWIRQSGAGDGEISFTVYPPGAAWTAEPMEDAAEVPVQGASWPEPSEKIKSNTVEYIELNFLQAGSYTFKLEGSEQIYGYLTSSTNIDSNGVPTSILASSTGSSSGFEFSYSSISTEPTYYLMIRTPSGSPNSYSFTLSVIPGSATYYYAKQVDVLSVAESRHVQYTIPPSTSAYNGVYARVTFATEGTARISADSQTITNHVIYVTSGDYGYNRSTGAPYTDASQTTEATGASAQQFRASSSGDYYVWIRGTPPNVSGYIIVTYAITIPEWTYPEYDTDVYRNLQSVTTTSNYDLSEKYGARIRVSFRSSGNATLTLNGMSGATMYFTSYNTQSSDGTYGFDSTDGVPYVDFQHNKATGGRNMNVAVSAGTTYWIWMSPQALQTSGTVNVTIVPPGLQWQDSQTGAVMYPNSISLAYQSPNMYYCNVTFNDSGTAEFYSDTSLLMSVVSWLTDSYQGIDRSSGTPHGTILVQDTDGGRFSYSYSVTAGVTYCFWFRPEVMTASGQIVVYIKAPESPTPPTPTTDRGFWIGTADGWHKLTVYIGNASHQWVEYKPYIAVGGQNPEWIDEY